MYACNIVRNAKKSDAARASDAARMNEQKQSTMNCKHFMLVGVFVVIVVKIAYNRKHLPAL